MPPKKVMKEKAVPQRKESEGEEGAVAEGVEHLAAQGGGSPPQWTMQATQSSASQAVALSAVPAKASSTSTAGQLQSPTTILSQAQATPSAQQAANMT